MNNKLVAVEHQVLNLTEDNTGIGIADYQCPNMSGAISEITHAQKQYPQKKGNAVFSLMVTGVFGPETVIEVRYLSCFVNQRRSGLWAPNTKLQQLINRQSDVRDVLVVPGKQSAVIVGTAGGSIVIYRLDVNQDCNTAEYFRTELPSKNIVGKEYSTGVSNMQLFYDGNVPHILVATSAVGGYSNARVLEFVLGETAKEVTNQNGTLSQLINSVDRDEHGFSTMEWLVDNEDSLHLVLGGFGSIYDVIKAKNGWSLNSKLNIALPMFSMCKPFFTDSSTQPEMLVAQGGKVFKLVIGKKDMHLASLPDFLKSSLQPSNPTGNLTDFFTYLRKDGNGGLVLAYDNGSYDGTVFELIKE